jgi:hypothetical protein
LSGLGRVDLLSVEELENGTPPGATYYSLGFESLRSFRFRVWELRVLELKVLECRVLEFGDLEFRVFVESFRL